MLVLSFINEADLFQVHKAKQVMGIVLFNKQIYYILLIISISRRFIYCLVFLNSVFLTLFVLIVFLILS